VIAPRIGVSACLLGERVRFNGMDKRNEWITETLAAHVQLVPTCPEVFVGLGVPRPALRLIDDGNVRLVEVTSGKDLTAEAAIFLTLSARFERTNEALTQRPRYVVRH
jgi:uncharacterized protein YbbK (DUF523 family)